MADNTRLLSVRFWAKVNKDGPVPAHIPELGKCWVWTGSTNGDGYGTFTLGSKLDCSRRVGEKTHRVAWFMANGKWPQVHVLHRCDNPACVRIKHLFLGNHADNMADKKAKGRTSHGASHPRAKLTDEEARQIIFRKANGDTVRKLAREFGVACSRISEIGRTSWTHLGICIPLRQRRRNGTQPTELSIG
jgi:hypothetical protein